LFRSFVPTQRASACVALAVLALPGAAQERAERGSPSLRPRWRPQKSEEVILTAGHDPGRIVLKLEDGAGARAAEGALVGEPGAAELAPVRQRVAALGAWTEPLFPFPAGELDELRRAGEARSGEELFDLTQFFRLSLPPGADPVAAVRALRALELVEDAYIATRPPPLPGDYSPTTPGYDDCNASSDCQGYLDPAPGGLDVAWARGQLGGRGEGLQVGDVEYAWNLKGLFGETASHEDILGVGKKAAVGDASGWSDPGGGMDHGTACAGILVADEDAFGITGLAPAARLRVRGALDSGGLNIAAAIVAAARALAPGDVLLVEMQNFGPNYDPGYNGNAQFGMVPVEYYLAEYAAIRLATARCIQVVEAAGNGEQDLDDTSPPYGHSTYPSRFDPRVRHSGAVLVGAGTAAAPHLRMWFSNHGERIGAYAWGEQVVTLGYGDLFAGDPNAPDADQYYTETFAGTSSASAIVAGAAAILGSAHAQLHQASWPPRAFETFLRSSGTDTSQLYQEEIGRQPDLLDQLEIAGMGPRPALVFTDEGSGFYVLDSIAALGDVDQDGTPDYAVGSSQAAGGYGRVIVYSGLTGAALRVLQGEAVGDRFGISVAGAGDADGDGVPDLAVGAFWNDAGGNDAGRAYVFSGADGSPLYTFTGATGNALGFAVDGAGDVDLDGYGDVVVGAIGYAGGTGRATVFSGFDGSVLHTFTGSASPGNFGQAVAGAGDVDGDGHADVIVGAPWTGGGMQIGEATVFSGATGSALFQWSGGSNFGGFGFAVDGAGDVDADGFDDLIVGQPYWDPCCGDNGAVHVYSGKSGQELFAGQLFGSFNANFGFSVAGAGDVNADGHADFLVGAPLDGYPSARGRVELRDGQTGAVLASYAGQPLASALGYDVAGAGDLDGDGRDDVFAGAQWWSPLANGAGRGYVFVSANPRACSLPRPAGFQ